MTLRSASRSHILKSSYNLCSILLLRPAQRTVVPTTSTSTTTLTITNTRSITPTSTITKVTGYKTITARRETITKISTIKPRPKTIEKVDVKISTVRLTCIPPSKPPSGHHRRQAPAPVFEIPNCGAVTPTTLTTSTLINTIISISTDVITQIDTSTKSTRTTLPPSTKILRVKGTRTTTPPPKTVTDWKLGPRKTVTSTIILEIIETVLPYGRRTPQCTPRVPPKPKPGARCGSHH